MYHAGGDEHHDSHQSHASGLSEISDAGVPNVGGEEKKQAKVPHTQRHGKVTIEELITELRHKYLTILKSQYWEFFEEGQCMPDSVVVLIESADRAMDHEETPMEDWTFIKSYIISDTFLSVLSGLSQIPLVGKIFRAQLFDHFSQSYDIIVNFIEGHEQATRMIKKVIKHKDFVNKILLESEK